MLQVPPPQCKSKCVEAELLFKFTHAATECQRAMSQITFGNAIELRQAELTQIGKLLQEDVFVAVYCKEILTKFLAIVAGADVPLDSISDQVGQAFSTALLGSMRKACLTCSASKLEQDRLQAAKEAKAAKA
jgi:hypothetical protein